MRLFRIERGIKNKARQLVAAHLAELSPPNPREDVFTASDPVRLLNQSANMPPDKSEEFGRVTIEPGSIPGNAVFITINILVASPLPR